MDEHEAMFNKDKISDYFNEDKGVLQGLMKQIIMIIIILKTH